MSIRRLTGYGWVVLLVVLAILSYFGNRTIFYVYLGLLIPFGIFHSVAICARCTNVYCPLNSKSSDFIFWFRQRAVNKELEYSDKSVLWVQVLLVLIVAIPFVAVWQLSSFAFFVVLAFLVLNMFFYNKESCRYCTNNCLNNKNPGYWKWKNKTEGRD